MCFSHILFLLFAPAVPVSNQADAAAGGKGRGGRGQHVEQGLKDFPDKSLVADEPVDDFFHTRVFFVFVCVCLKKLCFQGGSLPHGCGGGSTVSRSPHRHRRWCRRRRRLRCRCCRCYRNLRCRPGRSFRPPRWPRRRWSHASPHCRSGRSR